VKQELVTTEEKLRQKENVLSELQKRNQKVEELLVYAEKNQRRLRRTSAVGCSTTSAPTATIRSRPTRA